MKDSNPVGKFATINTESYNEYSLPKGTTVVIAGSGFAPIDDDDNYKLLFVVSKFENGKTEDHGVTVARKHLDILPEDVCKGFQEQLEKNYAANDKEANTPPTTH